MNRNLDIEVYRYPFIESGKPILKELGLTMELIDTTKTHDETLKDACKDIVDSIIRNRKEWDLSISDHYEVAKFYMTLIILKTLPFLVTRYFIADYIRRFEQRYDQDIRIIQTIDETKLVVYISKFLQQFGLELKQLNFDYMDHTVCGMHITDYLEIGTLVKENDPPEYKKLTLINRHPHLGYVFFNIKQDYPLFKLMFNKLIEHKIIELIRKLDVKYINSNKVQVCTREIKKYLKSSTHLKEKIEQQENIQNGISKPYEHKDTANPPCIIHILQKFTKKEKLNPAENVLLGSYLVKRGFTEDQIVDIFSKAVNYNEKVAKYNIKYLIKRDMTPMNCRNIETEGLCFKNDTCKKLGLINPLGYRNV